MSTNIEIRDANNDRHLVIFGSCQDIYYWWSCSRFYLEILNACKIIENSNLALYSYPNHFDANHFRAQSLYDINQPICFNVQTTLILSSVQLKRLTTVVTFLTNFVQTSYLTITMILLFV